MVRGEEANMLVEREVEALRITRQRTSREGYPKWILKKKRNSCLGTDEGPKDLAWSSGCKRREVLFPIIWADFVGVVFLFTIR